MSRWRIFWLWLPLAVSFTLMMLEGPGVQAAVARLDDPALHLAAFGLVMSLSLIIESPVIMLLSTSIALSRDAQAYRALRRFVIMLILALTGLTALVAWTPLYDLVVGGILGIPTPIAEAARPALRVMLLWTAAIGWRRFYQGILVRHRRTGLVSVGTAIRLLSSVGTALGLMVWGGLPGAQVAAWALMAGVITEALAIHLFALPIVRQAYAGPTTSDAPLALSAIARFHAPLAGTSLLNLLAQPMTAAALARLPQERATLAAWPVVFSMLLVLRGWGMALQETTISQAGDPATWQPLRDFTLMVAAGTSLATAMIAMTPLHQWYLSAIVSLEIELHPLVRSGLVVGMALPAITALVSWLRGMLVATGSPSRVYRGMGVNLLVNGLLLITGVALQLPGIPVAAGALLVANLAEGAYLRRSYRAIRAGSPATAARPVAS